MTDEKQPATLAEALDALRRLEAENAQLRSRLAAHEQRHAGATPAVAAPVAGDGQLDARSAPTRKVALFHSLFRGRDDVYALRWEREGRSGYAPALRPGVPRGREVQHAPSDYLPMTQDVVRAHLTGACTLGIYPLLRDETCWFLAMDFDKQGWRQDALAALDACDRLGVPAALERSRSGNGAHVWVFFTQPVAASLARSLGSAVLTHALDRRYQIGLDSYDRLFPSQDTLPTGGFGNLIAAPLQGISRRSGNTVFLDRDLDPEPDQWRLLSSIRRLEPSEAEAIVGQAAGTGTVIAVGSGWSEAEAVREPWLLPPSRIAPEANIIGPLPARVNVVLAKRVFVEKQDLPSSLINRLRRLAAFQNPEFYRAQRMRLSTFGKPRLIDCSQDLPSHLALPRGCLGEVLALLERIGISAHVTDERNSGTTISVAFRGALTPSQQQAADALAAYDKGVLCAPTAFGKTVVGAWLIAKRGVSTLVLVHRQHLADHWRERLTALLDLPPRSLGQFGAGKHRPTGTVDVALLQSLTRKGDVRDVVADYGQVIVDECHHVPAFSFERVLAEAHARYVVGLTATPLRKDGHHPIIAMQCGPIRFTVDAKAHAATRPFDHRVVLKRTDFCLRPDDHEPGIQEIYAQLAADDARTALIVSDVVLAVQAGRSPLVLTERTVHLGRMAAMLTGQVQHVLVLRGGMGTRERRRLSERLRTIPEEEPRVLLTTGRYIGEGFDDARLDTLFLAMPVSWRGTIQQYAGRLHRFHANKRVVQIFDYVDTRVPMLVHMRARRLKGYKAIGYSVVGEAQA